MIGRYSKKLTVANVAVTTVSVLLGLPLGGCTTSPKVYQIETTRRYTATYDKVWSDLMRFFTSYNVQIRTIEKESGVVYAERMTFDDSQADCGYQWPFVQIGRTLTLNVFALSIENDHAIQVTVNSNFTEQRRNNLNKEVVQDFHCNSTGAVESVILDSIR